MNIELKKVLRKENKNAIDECEGAQCTHTGQREGKCNWLRHSSRKGENMSISNVKHIGRRVEVAKTKKLTRRGNGLILILYLTLLAFTKLAIRDGTQIKLL